MYRIDVKTGEYENPAPPQSPAGKQISAYGMPTDQQNNVYQLEFGGTSIGIRDAKTGIATIFQTPIKNSRPRRGRVDEQNRLWFAEFGGNAVGLFDPQTAAIKEYPIPGKFTLPYDAVPNKDASQVWTGSMLNDHVARVATKTGQVSAHLLPRPPTSGASSCRKRPRRSGSAATTAPPSSGRAAGLRAGMFAVCVGACPARPPDTSRLAGEPAIARIPSDREMQPPAIRSARKYGISAFQLC